MEKRYKLTQDGEEVQGLLNKIDGLHLNQSCGCGTNCELENIKLNNIVYTVVTRAVNNLLNYYTKSETYTKNEVNSKLSSIHQFSIKSVDALPRPSALTTYTLYLVPSSQQRTGNLTDEFITVYRDGSYVWEQVGSTAIDLSEYVTIDAMNEALANYVTNAEPLTYTALANLRRTGKLVPGRSYRITDYVATTAQADTRSANHPFDIVVMAISETTLSEDAKAVLHEGDTYFSGAGAKLESWVVKYCFDNDTSRFAWADPVNGKGVIYLLIDEHDNNVPYDFKSIQFKRHRVTAKTEYQEQFGCIDGLYVGIPGLNFGVLDIDANDYKWYYTFSQLGENFSDEIVDASLAQDFVCRDNDFHIDLGRDHPVLLDMVFANGVALQTLMSSIGNPYVNDKVVCVNMHCEASSNQLTMFGITANNFMKSQFRRNLSIGIVRHSSCGTDCQGNMTLILHDFSFVTIGEYCEGNVLMVNMVCYCSVGGYFKGNKVISADSCNINTLGSGFEGNVFSGKFNNNTLNGPVLRSEFKSMTSCTFHGQINDCKFLSEINAVVLSGILSHLTVPEVIGKGFRNVDVKSVRGNSGATILLDHPEFYLESFTGVKRRVEITGDINGNVVATWKEGGQTVGVMKAPGSSEWTDIPAVEVDSMTASEVAAAVNTAWDNVMNA